MKKSSLSNTKNTSFASNRSFSQQIIPSAKINHMDDDEMGGMINLFGKFTTEELDMMESDEDYFLGKK